MAEAGTGGRAAKGRAPRGIGEGSALAMREAVARGETSARELVSLALAGIETLNPALNAVCTLNERALEEAEALDRRLARGEAPRALEGVPVLVKDNIETAGLRTTWGSLLFEEHVPEVDAIAVERLRAAGAIVVGKTNTPEFATDINTTNRLFGQTRNPWDLNVTPGGSSGGTGAAVAAGMVPLGLGTDLGGSIRIPASFNGLVGMRTAPGRVPVWPQEFAWDTLIAHVQGPLARSVADLGLALGVLAGPDERDPTTLPPPAVDLAAVAREGIDLRGCRVAWAGDLGGVVPLDPEVEARTRAGVGVLESLGCIVEPVTLEGGDVRRIMTGTRGFNLVARYGRHFDAERARTRLTPAVRRQIEGALRVSLRDLAESERLRTALWHRFRAVLERYDFIVTPTVGAPPFRLDEPLPGAVGGRAVAHFYDVILTTYTVSLTGLPALSLPVGWTQGGLPVGMQVVGPRQGEHRLLGLGAAFERAAPEWFGRIPEPDPASARPATLGLDTPGVPVGRQPGEGGTQA